jgi:hypothetical protein
MYVCMCACADAETLQQRAERRSGAEALQAFTAAIVSQQLYHIIHTMWPKLARGGQVDAGVLQLGSATAVVLKPWNMGPPVTTVHPRPSKQPRRLV